jgi:hypothetical protein
MLHGSMYPAEPNYPKLIAFTDSHLLHDLSARTVCATVRPSTRAGKSGRAFGARERSDRVDALQTHQTDGATI